jgi:hypothetical protein
MFGNMSYQLLDMMSRSKREQDLKEVENNRRNWQFVQSRDKIVKLPVPQNNTQRGLSISHLIKSLVK